MLPPREREDNRTNGPPIRYGTYRRERGVKKGQEKCSTDEEGVLFRSVSNLEQTQSLPVRDYATNSRLVGGSSLFRRSGPLLQFPGLVSRSRQAHRIMDGALCQTKGPVLTDRRLAGNPGCNAGALNFDDPGLLQPFATAMQRNLGHRRLAYLISHYRCRRLFPCEIEVRFRFFVTS